MTAIEPVEAPNSRVEPGSKPRTLSRGVALAVVLVAFAALLYAMTVARLIG